MTRLIFPLFMLCAIVIAGCGGGGSGSPLIASPAAPTALATTAPLSASATTAVTFGAVSSTGGGTAISSATVTLPETSAATTASLSMQATLPAGAIAPALRSPRAGKSIGGSDLKPLTYFVFSVSSTVTISSWPGFTVGYPSAITGTAYVAVLDTSQPSKGWTVISSGVTANGNILVFPPNTFAPPGSPLTLTQGVKYDYVILTSASPATPAYCSNYTPASSPSVSLNITDNAGVGGTLVVYVYNATAKMYLDATGKFSSASAVPLPAACYTTASGIALPIPYSGYTSGAPLSGRILLAYAAGTPSTAPNPLPSGVGTNPNYASAALPWDTIEFAIPDGVVDTTQVNFLGLPIELSVSGRLPSQTPPATCSPPPTPASQAVPSIVGFSTCGFEQAFSDIESNTNYKPLLIAEPFTGGSIDYEMRILSPDSLSFATFDWNNLFTGAADAPSTAPCTGAGTSGGYLACVLAYYQAHPQIFTSHIAGITSSGDWFCATSDGTAGFIFEDVGTSEPTTCSPSPPPYPMATSSANPFYLPISTLTYGQAPLQDDAGCQYGQLYEQPYGTAFVDNQVTNAASVPPTTTGTGNLFQTLDAFAMWKALVADLNYGQAAQSTFNGQPFVHPGGSYPSPSPNYANYWKDPFYNNYAKVLHHDADGGYSYALAYDDLYGWSTSLSVGSEIDIRINAVPVSPFGVLNNPTPVGNPASCPSIPPEIGSYMTPP